MCIPYGCVPTLHSVEVVHVDCCKQSMFYQLWEMTECVAVFGLLDLQEQIYSSLYYSLAININTVIYWYIGYKHKTKYFFTSTTHKLGWFLKYNYTPHIAFVIF